MKKVLESNLTLAEALERVKGDEWISHAEWKHRLLKRRIWLLLKRLYKKNWRL